MLFLRTGDYLGMVLCPCAYVGEDVFEHLFAGCLVKQSVHSAKCYKETGFNTPESMRGCSAATSLAHSLPLSSSNVFCDLLTKPDLRNACMGTRVFAEYFWEKMGDLVVRFPLGEVMGSDSAGSS